MAMRSFARSLPTRAAAARRNGSSATRRRLSTVPPQQPAAKAAPAPPPPPPEGSPSGGGGGGKLLALAVLGGGAYYFRDDLMRLAGMDNGSGSSPSAEVDDSHLNVRELKQEVEKLGHRLEKEVEEDQAHAEEAAKVGTEAASETKVETARRVAEAAGVPNAHSQPLAKEPVDYEAVKEAIRNLLEDESHDDGSYGPTFVRLAWHNAGTYDKKTGLGGSEGAMMRFKEEGGWGANAGLDKARARLEAVKTQFPGITYSDLWSLAGTVAIEEMGGPEMSQWRPGRKDYDEGHHTLPGGLLPDADGRDHKDAPAEHLRDIFYRMGFNDQEIVALTGAHALGRCHSTASGYEGPWTRAPTTFSNEFYRLLLEERWSKKKTHKGKAWTGPEQYEDPSQDLMMLPTDLSLVQDPKFKVYVEKYAQDEEAFMKDFAKAWIKLQENGVRKFHGWRRYILFGPRE